MASDAKKAAVVAMARALGHIVQDARLTKTECQAIALVMLDAVPGPVLAQLAEERHRMQTYTCPAPECQHDLPAAAGTPQEADRG